MKRHPIAFIAVGLAVAAVPASASAFTITLTNDNTYSPSSAGLDLGDGSFDWQWGPGGAGLLDLHNVVSDDSLFTSGNPAASRPDGFSVTASAGTFPYFCVLHLGMEGVVSVTPVVAPTDTGQGPIRLSWASPDTTTGDSYDVRYRTGKKWKKWKSDTGKPSGVFGKRRKPVKVKIGPSYQFRARSRSGKKHHSDWSPALIVER
jgi:plastocyanin